MLNVYNLTNDTQYSFLEEDVTPEYAVAFCYCEEHNLLSALFASQQSNQVSQFLSTLPMTIGQHSIACGDWAAPATHRIN